MKLQDYGGVGGLISKVRSKRHYRANPAMMVICVVVPWLLFCLMFATMSFVLHYSFLGMTYLFCFIGFLCVLLTAKLAWDAVKKHKADRKSNPYWQILLAVLCFIAWALGVALGDLNFFFNTEPYYSVSNLNTYPNIDPSRMPGQQVMDAGHVGFVKGSKIDLSHDMAFHNVDVYCVAPIINGNLDAPGSYDFWAVGLNCCTEGKDGAAEGVYGVAWHGFSCGEYNNPSATSGLRVMRADQRSYFRLAVQQAESAYNIRAPHPLFFHWMQDVVGEIGAYMETGVSWFLYGACTFFVCLVFSVLAAAFVFSHLQSD